LYWWWVVVVVVEVVVQTSTIFSVSQQKAFFRIVHISTGSNSASLQL